VRIDERLQDFQKNGGDGENVRRLVSTAAELLDRTKLHKEPADPSALEFLRGMRSVVQQRLSQSCKPDSDGRFVVYQGIRGYAAEFMRGALSTSGSFLLSAARPWSFGPSQPLVVAHARRCKRRDPNVPGLVYKTLIRPSDVVFVDSADDGFATEGLFAEQEVMVWLDQDRAIRLEDVVDLNVVRSTPTVE